LLQIDRPNQNIDGAGSDNGAVESLFHAQRFVEQESDLTPILRPYGSLGYPPALLKLPQPVDRCGYTDSVWSLPLW
jgi:hypothetical protein